LFIAVTANYAEKNESLRRVVVEKKLSIIVFLLIHEDNFLDKTDVLRELRT